MGRSSYALFETAIGCCGIVWSERGIAAVQLPESVQSRTRARLLRRHPDASEAPPAPDVRLAIDAICALLRGEPSDLQAIRLDLDGLPPFNLRVYQVARAIPAGSTLSYGEVAARLDEPGAARAVGQALGRNPFPIIVPCHRVLAAGGRLGGFSANGGVRTKHRILSIEGAAVNRVLPLFDGDGPADPRPAASRSSEAQ